MHLRKKFGPVFAKEAIGTEPGAVATGLIVAIEASQEVIVDQPRSGGSQMSERERKKTSRSVK